MAKAIPAIHWRALALAALLISAGVPATVPASEATDSGLGGPLPPGSGPAPGCDAEGTAADPVVAGDSDAPCVAPDIERDRAYLLETSTPGGTMLHQGPALAIRRLHPVFVRRLAEAIREARNADLPSAGIFSAYRPPAFGVGGFSDKFNSLHSYGLAVDMTGIGGPGSSEAKLWHEIAGRHGIACPYGADNRREWNHCQPTRVKIILAGNPLRGTVSALGPVDLEAMFAVGDALVSGAVDGAGSSEPQPATDQAGSTQARGQPRPQGSAGRGTSIATGRHETDRTHARHSPLKSVVRLVANHSLHKADGEPNLRIMQGPSARHHPQAGPSRCRHLEHPRRDSCGSPVEHAAGKSAPAKEYRTSSLVRHVR